MWAPLLVSEPAFRARPRPESIRAERDRAQPNLFATWVGAPALRGFPLPCSLRSCGRCLMHWYEVRFANRSEKVIREPLRAMPQLTSLRFWGCSARRGLGGEALFRSAASEQAPSRRRPGYLIEDAGMRRTMRQAVSSRRPFALARKPNQAKASAEVRRPRLAWTDGLAVEAFVFDFAGTVGGCGS